MFPALQKKQWGSVKSSRRGESNKILELQHLLTQFSNVTTDFLRPWQTQISVIAFRDAMFAL